MNVNDVINPTTPANQHEMAVIILERQSILEDHYWKIEKRPSKIISPLNREGQIIIKDFLWRITEEIGEAFEARSKRESQDKVYEELADALHFVAGLCVVTDNVVVFQSVFEIAAPVMSMDIASASQRYILDAGVLGNTLKLKPWKQTDVVTDVPEFKVDLVLMIEGFLNICWAMGMNHVTLYDFYYRKSIVNEFRIHSNY